MRVPLWNMPGLIRRNLFAAAVVLAVASTTACASTVEAQPLPEVSAAELSELRLQYLSQVADRLGVAAPLDVELIRYIQLAEYGVTLAGCMQDNGYDVRATRDDGLDFSSLPTAQAFTKGSATAVTFAMCEAQYTADPRTSMDLNAEQLAVVYDYYAGDLRSCLASRGYLVSDPPSKQVFIDAYYDGGAWFPWNEVIDRVTDEEYYELYAACPQAPPIESLFGGAGGS